MTDAIEKIARALGCTVSEATYRVSALNAEGFAIVPQEPTEAMIKASCVFNRHHVTDCFKAMLAAGRVRPDDEPEPDMHERIAHDGRPDAS